MDEKEEAFIKETERGKEVYCELHEMINKYNRGQYGYGKASPMVELFVANLSEDDFYLLMRMPIGNISRVHYTQMRNRVRKERRDALWVKYTNENEDDINNFFCYLEEQGFKRKSDGGYTWVFVYLVKKEYAKGKAGIDMARRRLIKSPLSIDNFKKVYEIYKRKGTLDDPLIWNIVNNIEQS